MCVCVCVCVCVFISRTCPCVWARKRDVGLRSSHLNGCVYLSMCMCVRVCMMLNVAGASGRVGFGVLTAQPRRIGKYSIEERQEKIRRYREKKLQRNFKKTIKYTCRKTLADSRPRVHGRFAKHVPPATPVSEDAKAATEMEPTAPTSKTATETEPTASKSAS